MSQLSVQNIICILERSVCVLVHIASSLKGCGRGGGEVEAFKVWLTKVTEKDLGFQLHQINANVTAPCTVQWHILIGKEQSK